MSPREDGSWRNYYNPQGGYCVDYPARWITGDAFEGAGFYLMPHPRPHFRSLAEIDVAALPNPHPGATLIDEAQLHLDGLRKFELAERVRYEERRETSLFGSPALFARDTYYDPQNRTSMVDETVYAEHSGTLYRLALATRPDDLPRFEAVFQHLVASFRFDCAPHPPPRGFGSPRAKSREPKERSASIARAEPAHPTVVAP